MKLVSYLSNSAEHLGLFVEGEIYNLHAADSDIPDEMNRFLAGGVKILEKAGQINADILSGKSNVAPEKDYQLLAPVPHPTSCRDGYAFRQHVAAARLNRRVEMIAEFDQYPVFYFTNHNSIVGPGEIEFMPDHFHKLDFELEVAAVIGRRGRNIRAAHADEFIAGYMIMNDFSARTLQMEEMLLNLGPAKGKDFATATGPWMVTPDELVPYRVNPKAGHAGNSYALEMSCRVNGVEVSRGSMADMDWTFAEIIERCSYGVDLLPGDVIGSGTVGTGCFLELNGTGLLNNPDYTTQWLGEGDVVELEITGLGTLRNVIRKANSDYSILQLKKTGES